MKIEKYLVLLITILVVIGCDRRENELDSYAKAIADASRELTSEDIYYGLVPIRYEDSPLLEWKIIDSDSMVLVSTLQSTDWYYADIECGEEFTTSDNTEYMLWVTIPNELNQYLANEDEITDSTAIQQRLMQILGMKSTDTNSVVNLLWVNKSDIIRPSYNPDPTTTYGAIDYPESITYDWYKDWFIDNIAYSYESPTDGLHYPFTRLGYTYDWGNGKSKKYGLSEFVIKPSSTIILKEETGCWSYYNNI
ncbi:MAG: hypothetical protein R3Y22_04970 [Bacteroidales bacterium]